MRLLSLAPLSLAPLDPVAFIRAARGAGFDHVGLRTLAGSPDACPPDMPCLIADAASARRARAALDGEGVRVRELEFVSLDARSCVADCEPGIARGAMLGTGYLVAASRDDDPGRRAATFAGLVELAARYGMEVVIEFVPWCAVDDLASAVELAQASGAKVLIDVLHLHRSGAGPDDVARLDPALFPYVQLSDAPARYRPEMAEIIRLATEERMDPGTGELEVTALLAALPPGLPISLEVPQLRRLAALGPVEHARRLRLATEALLG